jgi:malic enzyme
MGMQQAQMQQDAGTAALRNSIELAETQGAQMTEMIAGAGAANTAATDAQVQQGLAMTDPGLGQNIDLMA